jgi:metallo-beta-lactamase family protein
MKIKVVEQRQSDRSGIFETRILVLVDCGCSRAERSEAEPPAGEPNMKLDAVLLTHGHLDHTGRLPLLTKLG